MRVFLILLLSVFLLPGCVAVALEETDVFGVKRTNVADYAYAAADVLLDEAVRAKRVTVKTPIAFERLVPLQGLDPQGRLAILLPEDMGTRMTERGYTAIGKERRLKPEYLIVGTYTLYHPYIQVSLRMVRADNRALLTSTSFKMPLTRNLRNLVSLPPIGVSFTDEAVVGAQKQIRENQTKKAPAAPLPPQADLPLRVIP